MLAHLAAPDDLDTAAANNVKNTAVATNNVENTTVTVDTIENTAAVAYIVENAAAINNTVVTDATTINIFDENTTVVTTNVVQSGGDHNTTDNDDDLVYEGSSASDTDDVEWKTPQAEAKEKNTTEEFTSYNGWIYPGASLLPERPYLVTLDGPTNQGQVSVLLGKQIQAEGGGKYEKRCRNAYLPLFTCEELKRTFGAEVDCRDVFWASTDKSKTELYPARTNHDDKTYKWLDGSTGAIYPLRNMFTNELAKVGWGYVSTGNGPRQVARRRSDRHAFKGHRQHGHVAMQWGNTFFQLEGVNFVGMAMIPSFVQPFGNQSMSEVTKLTKERWTRPTTTPALLTAAFTLRPPMLSKRALTS